MKDKDKIIESGDGLNFDEQLFKKNLMETLKADRKAKAEEANVNENEKKRVSISIDDANENAPVEPKKEEIAKEDISLQK